MEIIDLLNSFASKHPWVPLVLSIYLVIVKAVVGIRDSLDKSPDTDDSWFERLATVLKKTMGYLGGVRPSAPKGTVPVPGDVKDAAGVKVEDKK